MGRAKEQVKPKLGWGGRREGAGRKPKGEVAGELHSPRPRLNRRYPVLVTLPILAELGSLRTGPIWATFQQVFAAGAHRGTFKLVYYSLQADKIYLLVEADEAVALSRALTGLGTRMARNLNRTLARKGKVFSDRYHAHTLRSEEEIPRFFVEPDEFTSMVAVIAPDTALLKRLRE